MSRITGVVLAGGQGSRMGGVDKGLVPFRGRPLVEHVIERLRPQVDTILINANRNPEAYAAFGHPVISDEIEGFAGPLAGFERGLALWFRQPVGAEPVARLRQLVGRLEVPAVGRQPGGPDVGCLRGACHVLAILVERFGVVRRNLERHSRIQGGKGQRNAQREVQ